MRCPDRPTDPGLNWQIPGLILFPIFPLKQSPKPLKTRFSCNQPVVSYTMHKVLRFASAQLMHQRPPNHNTIHDSVSGLRNSTSAYVITGKTLMLRFLESHVSAGCALLA
jgi:hypothetical protein